MERQALGNTFRVVAISVQSRGGELLAKIGPCSQTEAIREAYQIVQADRRLGVEKYLLVPDREHKNHEGIRVHKGDAPICESCWEKNSEAFRGAPRYQNHPAELERCCICGMTTTMIWFARVLHPAAE
jgi:hypothetical protein